MTDYNEASIRVLKGLDPVRSRPGMYTDTTCPTHIITEVIDNAADEALGGYATAIVVTCHTDDSVSIIDNGRGIPVGLNVGEGVSTLEVVYTRLHAGAKFDKADGGAYSFSGGLHGVGVSVTNALSSKLEVWVKRDGKAWKLGFTDGNVTEPLSSLGDCGKQHGTKVQAWPNPKYFDTPKVKKAKLIRLLKAKAVLLAGVKVTFKDETDNSEQVWQYTEGLIDYLNELLQLDCYVSPIFSGEHFFGEDDPHFSKNEGAQWALAWADAPGSGESYVNLIPTPDGGTHESGLRSGLFESIKEFCTHHALLPRGITLQAEDVWRNVRFVLSTKILDPQFHGQVKEKLTSRDAVKLVNTCVRDRLDGWLNSNVEEGKKIAELAIRSAVSRQKASKVVERKKGTGVVVLPGKLTDCSVEDITRNELFLVEGDSAGGSAKQGRDREIQAVMPLRGKVINTWEQASSEIFGNTEVRNLSTAIGVDPHTLQDNDSVLSGLRYGKLIIMADADVDGSHIQTLILTLFYRHYPKLVLKGHIYIAQPPLYCILIAPQGKGKPEKRLYALDENERDLMRSKLRDEGIRDEKIHVGRFKGLGEMNADQLSETTMNQDTRRLLQIKLDENNVSASNECFTLLMKKKESGNRRIWMETYGHLVEADV
jgi:topoisomerase-4 subunit B